MIAVVYSFLADEADRNDERLWQAQQEPSNRATLDEQFRSGYSAEAEPDENEQLAQVIALESWARMANQGVPSKITARVDNRIVEFDDGVTPPPEYE